MFSTLTILIIVIISISVAIHISASESKKSKSQKKLIKHFDGLMNNIPYSEKEIPGLITKKWDIYGLEIQHDRLIRGDLISVKWQGEEIMSWVDQSYAYSSLLGVNDVYINIPGMTDYLRSINIDIDLRNTQ